MLVETFNFIFDTVALCCQVSVFIGYSIVHTVWTCLIWSFVFLKHLISIIQVLFEDFTAFLDEAFHVSEELAIYLDCTFQNIENLFGISLDSSVSEIKSVLKCAIAKEIAFFGVVFDLLVKSFYVWVDGLALIGSVAKETVYFVLNFIYNLVTAPVSSFIYICLSIYEAFILTVNTIIKLPLESAIGFFVVILAILLSRRYNGRKFVQFMLLLCALSVYRIGKMLMTSLNIVRWWAIKNSRRLYLHRLIKSRNRCRQESPSKMQLLKQLDQEMTLRMCVVCMSQPRNVILLNCQHFCMCESCAKQVRLMSNECPICRKHIYRILNVYMWYLLINRVADYLIINSTLLKFVHLKIIRWLLELVFNLWFYIKFMACQMQKNYETLCKKNS